MHHCDKVFSIIIIIQIPVLANKDMINDSDKTIMIGFSKISLPVGGKYIEFFDGYTLAPLPVSSTFYL